MIRIIPMASASAKPKNRLSPYLKTILAKVRPGWKRILDAPNVKKALHDAIRGLDKYLRDHGVTDAILEKYGLDYFILPAHENILAALHYFDPQNLVGIIIGQDPYPGLGSSSPNGIDACGMSFSVAEGRNTPSSLRNIYQALMHSKNVEGKPLLKSLPDTGNLINWAKRGMLMLNYYLTRSTKFTVVCNTVTVNGSGNADETLVHRFWAPFTENLLVHLTTQYLPKQLNHERHYVGVMLWGAVAKSLSRYIQVRPAPIQVEIMTHGHPSGLSAINANHKDSRAFINCTHFSDFIKNVPDFDWDPRVAPTDKPSRLTQFFSLLRELKAGGKSIEIDVAALLDRNIAYNDGTLEPNNAKIRALLQARLEAAKTTEKIEKELDTTMPDAAPSPVRKISKSEIWIALASDGGCEGNGARIASRSKASYGVAIPETFMGHPNAAYEFAGKVASISGPVPRFTLAMDRGMELVETNTPIQPSNGRGELLGAIYAMRLIYRCLYHLAKSGRVMADIAKAHVVLVCDATYVVHFINERMWKYRLKAATKRGGNWLDTVEKNRDLIEILGSLIMEVAKLRGGNPLDVQGCWDSMLQPGAHDYYARPVDMDINWNGLTVLYQHSHQQVPDNDTQLAKERWAMNKIADEAAEAALG